MSAFQVQRHELDATICRDNDVHHDERDHDPARDQHPNVIDISDWQRDAEMILREHVDDLRHLVKQKVSARRQPIGGPLLRQQKIQPIEELVGDANLSAVGLSGEEWSSRDSRRPCSMNRSRTSSGSSARSETTPSVNAASRSAGVIESSSSTVSSLRCGVTPQLYLVRDDDSL